MSIVKKLGLYEKDNMVEIPVPKYKTFTYTEKNKQDIEYQSKIPCLFIETNKQVKYNHGNLQINNKIYDVSLLKIKDIFDILENNNITVKIVEGLNLLLNMSTLFLSDFSNVEVEVIDGDISPYYFEDNKPNTSILPLTSNYNFNIIDRSKNEILEYIYEDNYLYFTPNKKTKIYVHKLSSSFYVFCDYSSKQIYNGNLVANMVDK